MLSDRGCYLIFSTTVITEETFEKCGVEFRRDQCWFDNEGDTAQFLTKGPEGHREEMKRRIQLNSSEESSGMRVESDSRSEGKRTAEHLRQTNVLASKRRKFDVLPPRERHDHECGLSETCVLSLRNPRNNYVYWKELQEYSFKCRRDPPKYTEIDHNGSQIQFAVTFQDFSIKGDFKDSKYDAVESASHMLCKKYFPDLSKSVRPPDVLDKRKQHDYACGLTSKCLLQLKRNNCIHWNRLQEYSFKSELRPPRYKEIGQRGKSNDLHFLFEVRFKDYCARGEYKLGKAKAVESAAYELCRRHYPELVESDLNINNIGPKKVESVAAPSVPKNTEPGTYAESLAALNASPRKKHDTDCGLSFTCLLQLKKNNCIHWNRLQEYSFKSELRPPRYKEIGQRGKSNDLHFLFEVRFKDYCARGEYKLGKAKAVESAAYELCRRHYPELVESDLNINNIGPKKVESVAAPSVPKNTEPGTYAESLAALNASPRKKHDTDCGLSPTCLLAMRKPENNYVYWNRLQDYCYERRSSPPKYELVADSPPNFMFQVSLDKFQVRGTFVIGKCTAVESAAYELCRRHFQALLDREHSVAPSNGPSAMEEDIPDQPEPAATAVEQRGGIKDTSPLEQVNPGKEASPAQRLAQAPAPAPRQVKEYQGWRLVFANGGGNLEEGNTEEGLLMKNLKDDGIRDEIEDIPIEISIEDVSSEGQQSGLPTSSSEKMSGLLNKVFDNFPAGRDKILHWSTVTSFSSSENQAMVHLQFSAYFSRPSLCIRNDEKSSHLDKINVKCSNNFSKFLERCKNQMVVLDVDFAFWPEGEMESHRGKKLYLCSFPKQNCFYGWFANPEILKHVKKALKKRALSYCFDLDETLLHAVGSKKLKDSLLNQKKEKIDMPFVQYWNEKYRQYCKGETRLSNERRMVSIVEKDSRGITRSRDFSSQEETAYLSTSDEHMIPVIRYPVSRQRDDGCVIFTIVFHVIVNEETSNAVRKMPHEFLFFVRPGWEKLKRFLKNGKCGVYVATASEKEYSYEAWRILDTKGELIVRRNFESNITNFDMEIDNTTGKYKEYKNLCKTVLGRQSSGNQLPFAVGIDDRDDGVYGEKDDVYLESVGGEEQCIYYCEKYNVILGEEKMGGIGSHEPMDDMIDTFKALEFLTWRRVDWLVEKAKKILDQPPLDKRSSFELFESVNLSSMSLLRLARARRRQLLQIKHILDKRNDTRDEHFETLKGFLRSSVDGFWRKEDSTVNVVNEALMNTVYELFLEKERQHGQRS